MVQTVYEAVYQANKMRKKYEKGASNLKKALEDTKKEAVQNEALKKMYRERADLLQKLFETQVTERNLQAARYEMLLTEASAQRDEALAEAKNATVRAEEASKYMVGDLSSKSVEEMLEYYSKVNKNVVGEIFKRDKHMQESADEMVAELGLNSVKSADSDTLETVFCKDVHSEIDYMRRRMEKNATEFSRLQSLVEMKRVEKGVVKCSNPMCNAAKESGEMKKLECDHVLCEECYEEVQAVDTHGFTCYHCPRARDSGNVAPAVAPDVTPTEASTGVPFASVPMDGLTSP